MRIASWNINSIRARIENVTNWIKQVGPDVLLLQEIKAQEATFPYMEMQALGYESHIVGQKSYNGVALLSRYPVSQIITTLSGDESDQQARFIQGTIQGRQIASIYLPNGNPVSSEKFSYKIAWMDRLKSHVENSLKLNNFLVLGGDFNVIPEEQDVYNSKEWENDALFRIETRKKWRETINLGLTDAYRTGHPHEKEAYTFWDYQAGAWPRNLGLRIDHFLLSPRAADHMQSCTIDRTPRGEEKASDHTPIILDLSD